MTDTVPKTGVAGGGHTPFAPANAGVERLKIASDLLAGRARDERRRLVPRTADGTAACVVSRADGPCPATSC